MGLARDTWSPMVWSRYDRLFRQSVAVNPALKWHRREPDLWLMASHESPSPAQASSSAHQPFCTASTLQSSASEDPCRRFNKGTCPFIEAQCRYKHVCQRCLSAGHVGRDCPRLQVPVAAPLPLMPRDHSDVASVPTYNLIHLSHIINEFMILFGSALGCNHYIYHFVFIYVMALYWCAGASLLSFSIIIHTLACAYWPVLTVILMESGCVPQCLHVGTSLPPY